ncbi:hypothetical protein NE236_36320 [Actinoallomurus purpureus]|uniref:hypothetical protein n=1 Tax=Actinoallomurus purpureus TaxID=478114 RepID=UPI002093F853|nr:hypothetical protein [Actinoallomurus purpureus]MCO6010439.1 hypothetical protein [Actinoallomurus purpureus]
MNLFWPIIVGLMAVGMAILGFQEQRTLWWRFQARWYANPEANEPSDSAFIAQRAVCFIVAAFMAFGAFQLYRIQDSVSWSGSEVRVAADQAARALQSDSVLIESLDKDGVFTSYVESAVRDAAEAKKNHVMLAVSRDEAQRSPGGSQSKKIIERYGITAKGEHAVCMTVTGNRGGKVTSVYKTPSWVPPEYYWKLSAAVAGGSC